MQWRSYLPDRRRQICENRAIWLALCAGQPWQVPQHDLDACATPADARGLHREMVVALRALETAEAHGVSFELEQLIELITAFPRVVGLQRAALAASLPLLSSQPTRKRAQASPLASLIVAAMRTFPDDVGLVLAALHTLVLLARPLDGAEGMVFLQRRMEPPRALDALLGEHGGVAMLLAAMSTHCAVADVQAMACWALVNVMLNPAQKALAGARGGLAAVLAAMRAHPDDLEVQYRSLFALINLLVPDGAPPRPAYDEVIPYVLGAMKNFERHEALVNRGCLVLHNLALSEVRRSAPAVSIAVG